MVRPERVVRPKGTDVQEHRGHHVCGVYGATGRGAADRDAALLAALQHDWLRGDERREQVHDFRHDFDALAPDVSQQRVVVCRPGRTHGGRHVNHVQQSHCGALAHSRKVPLHLQPARPVQSVSGRAHGGAQTYDGAQTARAPVGARVKTRVRGPHDQRARPRVVHGADEKQRGQVFQHALGRNSPQRTLALRRLHGSRSGPSHLQRDPGHGGVKAPCRRVPFGAQLRVEAAYAFGDVQ
mmetsp:Transcript_85184/g.170450  ORF Transcript_85184/g.170450 Transcript_85184/m.170450 type:complete len:239 (+) Transcript_85184:234-950(+)